MSPFAIQVGSFPLLHPNALSVFALGTIPRTQSFVPVTDRLSHLGDVSAQAASEPTKVRHVAAGVPCHRRESEAPGGCAGAALRARLRTEANSARAGPGRQRPAGQSSTGAESCSKSDREAGAEAVRPFELADPIPTPGAHLAGHSILIGGHQFVAPKRRGTFHHRQEATAPGSDRLACICASPVSQASSVEPDKARTPRAGEGCNRRGTQNTTAPVAIMSTFNHFRNKRQAHAVSRSSSEAWNPFRHVTWRSKSGRAETWAGGRLEEQPEGAPLTHSATAPTTSTGVPGGAVASGLGKDRDMDGSTTAGSKGNSSEERVTSRSIDGESAGLRNRKPDDEAARQDAAAAGPAEAEDDTTNKKKKNDSTFFRHIEPKEPFTVANQLQRTFLNSWINILLLAAPVGFVLNYVHSVSRVAVFVVNFIAIIPLAAMLSFATEEIALRTGETLGGLLNATFGNAVELIVAIIALLADKVSIVKTSLIGSILSNLLLVMGCCFFFGGLRRQEQFFNTTVAQTAASLLALAAASVIVPTVFDSAQDTGPDRVAALSRGTAVILLIVYAAYLFFQLKTHQTVFNAESQKVPAKPWNNGGLGAGAIRQGLAMPGSLMSHGMPDQNEHERLSKMLMSPPRLNKNGDVIEDDEDEEPQLHFLVALGTLAGSTVIIAFLAEFMVDSIDAVTKDGRLSIEFVGLILLPIVGNAAEHATAVTVAIKDKMDLAIGVAVGSSMQVALFLIPLLVVIGWGRGMDDMNLSFDNFQVAVMFVAVLLTNYLIGDGKSHWLEGFLLICLYAIIAVCSFYYPDVATGEKQSGAS